MDETIFGSDSSVTAENLQDNTSPSFEVGELVFEPAKEGDKLPEGIWIPNRAWRRAAKKNKNKKIKIEINRTLLLLLKELLLTS